MLSQTKLLEMIKLNNSTPYPISNFADELSLSTSDICEMLHELIDLGYPLEVTESTVALSTPMISQSIVKAKLKERNFLYTTLFYPRIESTNTEALKNLSELSDRTVLLTDYQYKGKGRLGREWQSPIGSAVTLSLVLKPDMSGEQTVLFTQLAAAALVQALAPYVSAQIKWPNDVIVDGKKLAGILTETSYCGSDLEGVVVGVGINTSLAADDINPALSDKATSLLIETQKHIDPNHLISDFLSSFDTFYRSWQLKNDSSDFIRLCKEASVMLGKEIVVRSGESSRLAHVRDINASGELVVQYNDEAKLTPLRTLDFSIRGIHSYI
ncbi:biotin--[acetyl-CoA-carboxylase] ligase [Alkalibacterium psychrotolerans]